MSGLASQAVQESTPQRRFGGKVVVVTGAGSGIGRAAARRFLSEGARVIAVDLDGASIAAWAGDHPDIRTVIGSVADEDTSTRTTTVARDTWGRLDIAFLNAGVVDFGSVLDLPMDALRHSIEINLIGTMLGVRAAARAMIDDGAGGAIVATASVSALLGDVNLWAYNASKAAVVNAVRSIAAELAPQGVRVNSVLPGPIVTGLTTPQYIEKLTRQIPMARYGEADEVANAVLFLASDEASFITGVALPVDGGVSAVGRTFPA